MPASPLRTQGDVIAAYGRHYLVQLDDERVVPCVLKGRDLSIAANDRVSLELKDSSAPQGIILEAFARRNLLWREDAVKRKMLAANVDLLAYVVAVDPSFSPSLLSRALTAADAQGLDFVIVLNKSDLPGIESARELLRCLTDLGVPVLEISAKHDPSATLATLQPVLSERCTLLAGQSGMGKSTLVNALVPEAQADTQEVSLALNSGKHTTTHARRYRLNANYFGNAQLIDTPGFQQFGLAFLDRQQLQANFRGLGAYVGHCRYADCRHHHEPNCAVVAAVNAGEIHPQRYQHYLEFQQEIESAHAYLKRTGRGR